MIRTFIGIELAPKLRSKLAQAVERMRIYAPQVAWVIPENFHLTLKFIGNVPDRDLPELFAATEEVAAISPAFNLKVQGIDAFPQRHSPRVLTATASCELLGDDIATDSDDLLSLFQASVNSNLDSLDDLEDLDDDFDYHNIPGVEIIRATDRPTSVNPDKSADEPVVTLGDLLRAQNPHIYGADHNQSQTTSQEQDNYLKTKKNSVQETKK